MQEAFARAPRPSKKKISKGAAFHYSPRVAELRPMARKLAPQVGVNERYTGLPNYAQLIMQLQRLAGNEAVTSLLAGSRPPESTHSPYPFGVVLFDGVLQREKAPSDDKGGWKDADNSGDGWNVHARTVKGTGIIRIPVEGITLGNQEAFYGTDKKNTDAAKTTESAAGKAIVLIPEGLKPEKPIDVMLHLHGYEFRSFDPYAGWRQRSGDHKVRDVDQDRLEQQMGAAGTTQVIGVLAQGIGESRFGSGKKKYDLPYNDYIKEVLEITAKMGFPQLPKPPKSWQLILSAHSGGGLTVAKASEKIREPANLAEIVLLDALNSPAAADRVGEWAEEHMERVREAKPDDRAGELAKCPKLRGYYSGAYAGRYERLQKALKKSFERNPPEVDPHLRARFKVTPLAGTVHETVVRGLGDDPAAGPIADALVSAHDPEAKSRLLEHAPAKTKPSTKGRAPAPKATPAGKTKTHAAAAARPIPAGAITSDRLGDLSTKEETAFRRAVYDEQLRQNLADPSKEFFPGLPEDQIGKVQGEPIRKDVEADAQNMFNGAVAAWKSDKQDKKSPRHDLAVRCSAIGINNAYRPLDRDFKAWVKAYPQALDRTEERRKKLANGQYSREAVLIMVNDLHDSKALPGFSKHTRGLAIDFETTQNGQDLGPSKKQNKAWYRSWLHHWLVDNHKTYHFEPLESEAFHWAHVDGGAGKSGGQAAAGAATSARAKAAPAPPKAAKSAAVKSAAVSSAKPAAVAATQGTAANVRLSFGPRARADVVAESSLQGLRDVLHAAGLKKATITSTYRTAEDQARAMYNNLVGHGKGQGLKKQRRLYRNKPGSKVIDTFVALSKKGLSPDEIRKGMVDKIGELGAANVSRHSWEPAKLNVIDLGPASIGGDDANAALVVAAKAEEGKRVSRFIPYPGDPGQHFEIPPR